MVRWRQIRWKGVVVSFAFMLAIAGCGTGSQTDNQANDKASMPQVKISDHVTVNIGVQQSLGALWLAKEEGWFEKEFAKVGATVNWIEFQSGPPYFQAVASDRLDFGQVGNTPVLVGQAAGVDFKEISTTGFAKQGDTILIPKGSPIKSVADLKEKK